MDCGKGRHTFVTHIVTQLQGAHCDQCGKHLPRWSTQVWRCAVCAATACPACKRAEPAAEDDWERLIFTLPSPLLGKTVTVPHCVARKYAACCCRGLEVVIDAAAWKIGNYYRQRRREEAFSRLAVAMPYLLLFEPRSASDASRVSQRAVLKTDYGTRSRGSLASSSGRRWHTGTDRQPNASRTGGSSLSAPRLVPRMAASELLRNACGHLAHSRRERKAGMQLSGQGWPRRNGS